MARSKLSTTALNAPPSRGRPRDPVVEARLQSAILETLAERGFSGLTVDAVCVRAEMPRSSFYRRWESATEALTDAFNAAARIETLPDTGELLGDLVTFAEQLTNLYGDPILSSCMAYLMAEARLRPDLHGRLRADLQVRRAYNQGMFERAIARGEALTIDPDLVLDVINGLALSYSGRREKLCRADYEILLSRLLRRSDAA